MMKSIIAKGMKQVKDDPESLKLMLKNLSEADNLYKPCNYWTVYERRFIPELHNYGLHDFRRRKNSVLDSFGGVDLAPPEAGINLFQTRILNNRITRKIPLWLKLIALQNRIANRLLKTETPYGITTDGLRRLFCDFARVAGEKAGAKPIGAFDASMVGNPEDVFEFDGKSYTMSMVYYYLRYVYCCNYIDFEDVDLIVELGSGSGKLVELIKKLHPHLSFCLFDIPPQLYVCQQYLSAVFPDCVVPYEATKSMEALPRGKGGKIYICGTWKIPILKGGQCDLFVNTASFQEMEPDVVANYLNYVSDAANSVYLQEEMQGKPVAVAAGQPGVLRQTVLEDYRNGLKNYDLVDLSPSLVPVPVTGWLKFSDSFWRRKM
jgi:putative sugar O-methyltransferase